MVEEDGKFYSMMRAVPVSYTHLYAILKCNIQYQADFENLWGKNEDKFLYTSLHEKTPQALILLGLRGFPVTCVPA